MDDAGVFFGKMGYQELMVWKNQYEVLIKDNGPGSSKKAKMPHMIPAWEKGLAKVNELLEQKKPEEKQMTMF